MTDAMDENVNILELQVKCQKVFTQIVRSYPIMPGLVIELLNNLFK